MILPRCKRRCWGPFAGFHVRNIDKRGAARALLTTGDAVRALGLFAQSPALSRRAEVMLRDGLIGLAQHDPFCSIARKQRRGLTGD